MDKSATKIGKDVIESLTLGMYEDSRFVYREYIQNSADQIDRAVDEGIFSSLREGKIEISIRSIEKYISISDNATGIPTKNVQSVLKNIAQSTKDRAKNKGFRGIGRLGGLAYCNKLIFETSFKSEDLKSVLIWDSQKLKSIINNRSTKEEAVDVIDEVTSFYTEEEKSEVHYFKVSLEGVNNSILLDKNDIYRYLTMVAPVPYSKGFFFKEKIYDKSLELSFKIDEYSIFVNRNQVFKAYTTSIYEGNISNKKKIDEIHDLETYELKTAKGKLLAWGWFSITSLIKQMPIINTARNIRLRKGNIQIGMEKTLDKLFKDARWSRYYFGEIHVVTADLIPNARRDYFLESKDLDEFERLVKIKFNELEKLNYFSSNLRSNKKKLDELIEFTKEFNDKSTKDGFTNNKEKDDYIKKFEDKKEKAENAKKEIEKFKEKVNETSSSQKIIFDKIVGRKQKQIEEVTIENRSGKTKFITDDITKLSRKDRKLVSRIFGVVDLILTPDLASLLKEKIKEDLNK